VRTVDRLYSYVVGGPANGASRVRRLHLLYIDSARVGRDRAVDPILDALESDVHGTTAILSPRRVFVHAGVVGWNGQAIVVPGMSESGKTMLVAELVRAGATYYSDDYAVLDAQGRVHPFAKRLSIRGDGERSAAELGGKIGSRPLRVGLIAFAPYRAGAAWRPRESSASEGALELLKHTIAIRSDPPRAVAAVRAATDRARIIRGARGEAAEIAQDLLARLS
jgi:hypothetical protein